MRIFLFIINQFFLLSTLAQTKIDKVEFFHDNEQYFGYKFNYSSSKDTNNLILIFDIFYLNDKVEILRNDSVIFKGLIKSSSLFAKLIKNKDKGTIKSITVKFDTFTLALPSILDRNYIVINYKRYENSLQVFYLDKEPVNY